MVEDSLIEHSLACVFILSISCKKTEDVIITDGMLACLLVWLRPQTC